MSWIKDHPEWKPSPSESEWYMNQKGKDDPIENDDNSLRVTVSMKELRELKEENETLKHLRDILFEDKKDLQTQLRTLEEYGGAERRRLEREVEELKRNAQIFMYEYHSDINTD
jgi:hypothetical protein